ncbi:MAG TPA: thiamine ABC transporter substrate-binding protein [Caldilineaceae bacterium]|nr:thiamine ABC transporter substrate-binding protein [Caldilineaceae bacterium]
MRSFRRLVCLLLLGLTVAACQPVTAPATATEHPAPTTLVVASHDSFNVSESVVAQFEQEHNAKVQFLALGDAGEAVNRIILSKDAPLADLFFGVDNTFLSRALDADVFAPYASPLLKQIPDELKLDAEDRLLPVDVGYVNLNADGEWFQQHGIPLPQSLEDLIKPAYKGLLVVPNPATSSPGLAFLLATISHFGEDHYLTFWEALRANDLLVTDGWSEAYFEHFTVGSGGAGGRPLVVSYTTSPPADVVYATDGRTVPASQNLNLAGGVFRQIEFVGLLKGAKQPELAKAWIDFMLGLTFQEDMPLQMFVYPARPDAKLPDLFQKYAEVPAETAQMDAAAIEQNREKWIEAWTNVVLR